MEQLLVRNENENNELVSNIFLGLSAIILLIWGLSLIGIFSVGFYTISTLAIIFVSLLLLPSVFIKLSKTRSPLVKYILIFDISLLTSLGYLFFTYQMVIMFILPVLISLLYMNKKLMWFSEGISLLFIVVIHLISAKFVRSPGLNCLQTQRTS